MTIPTLENLKRAPRAIICSCVLLLAANSAQAYQYCGNLPKNSAAYYSCEALNQQERFERDRKQEAKEQDEKRAREQRIRDWEVRRDREERAEAQDRLTRMGEALELLPLLPIVGGIETADKALEAGKCDQAQRVLDDIQPKIKDTKTSYSANGKVITREDIENAFLATQSKIYVTCLNGREGTLKLLGYLEREATNGNKMAGKLLVEVQRKVGRKSGKNTNVPKFSDYGTDMASLKKYLADLDETSIDACRESWKNKKDADAALCVAHYESGSSMLVFQGADPESLPMLREAAKLGHPIAQNNLAEELAASKRPGNSAEIARLIKASANSGLPHAQVTVGWWHMTGEHGFKIDYSETMKWNLKAYKQGHSEGANNIGELYEKGLGVTKDIEQAKSWYRKASVLGNAEATERLEKLGRN